MRFAIVSDTHDNINAVRELVEELKKEKLDFIVHAGDVVAPFTLKEFFPLELKLYIAFGNNDGERKLLSQIAQQRGWEIGEVVEFPAEIAGIVYHGTDRTLLNVLKRTDYEIVVFGHTHEPAIERTDSKLIVNPGEVCGYLTGRRTYAIYEDGEVSILELR